jgi:hypothetical protein
MAGIPGLLPSPSMPTAPLPPSSIIWPALCLALVLAGGARAEDSGVELRVESDVFVDHDDTPVSRSLTLVENGIAWNFLDPSPDDPVAIGEVIVHDPARERVVVLDGRHGLKTEIRTIRLDRLNVSLASWARQSDDPLIRWAGGPEVGESLVVGDGRVDLAGPRVRYEVEFTTVHGNEAATAYRRFADTAILLKALMQPGGIPPFPRLAINRRVEAAGGIPSAVRLEIGPKLPLVPGGGSVLRSIHKVHPQLIEGDRGRIGAAASRLGVADTVELDEFVRRRQVDAAGHGGS